MPSGKPPLLSHIEELKKQITALSADITEIKSLLIKYSQLLPPQLTDSEEVEKPEIPFEKPQAQGWWW